MQQVPALHPRPNHLAPLGSTPISLGVMRKPFYLGVVALGAWSLFVVVACGGETLDGQHDSCSTTDDCGDIQLECVSTESGSARTCEVVCTVEASDSDECPLHQDCTDLATGPTGLICYEGPA